MTNRDDRAAILAAARAMGTQASVQQHFNNEDAKARGLAAMAVVADGARSEAKDADAQAAWKRVVARRNGNRVEPKEAEQLSGWAKVVARHNERVAGSMPAHSPAGGTRGER